jgi:MerR family transcriptional regulator/heat shock protein HspR
LAKQPLRPNQTTPPLDPPAPLDRALADLDAPRYTVGQVSELLGVRPWFLRRLDTLGLVTPSRSGGAQRRYSRRQLDQVADARALMDDGVSSAGVRKVFELQAQVGALQAELAETRAERAASGGPASRQPHHAPDRNNLNEPNEEVTDR